jgi:anti-sigma-K factor RskA
MATPDPKDRHLLAAEYVLGTLRGSARRRFERMREEDAKYCKDAEDWENKLNLLAEGLPGVEPPESVWQGIERRLSGQGPAKVLWRSASFWRGVSAVATAVAAALLILFIQTQPPAPPAVPSQVAVLSDKDSHPAWLIRTDFGQRMLAVEALQPQDKPTDTSFELWMIPGANQPPRSLGLLAPSGTLRIPLSDPQLEILKRSGALAVSLEPAGGSPTGLPTGPVLYQGALVPTKS